MPQMLRLILRQIARTLRSRAELHAENLALRHQVEILKRRAPKRVRLTNGDRFLLTWLFRLCPRVARAVTIVHPETLVRWHRQGFRSYWRCKSRPRGGRPKVPKELRDLIRQMSAQNPLWGAPRIHGEILKLGFDVSQATVSKYMVRHTAFLTVCISLLKTASFHWTSAAKRASLCLERIRIDTDHIRRA